MPLFDDFPTTIAPDIYQAQPLPEWKQSEVKAMLPTPFNYDINGIGTKEESLQSILDKKHSNYLGGVSYGEGILFNDKNLGFNKSKNNEDIYSSKSNWYYGLRGAGSSAVDWMKEGVQGIGDIFNSVADLDVGKLYDSPHTKELMEKQSAMMYDNPTYRSKEGQDHPWNVFATGVMASNAQMIGMTVGTVISTLALDAAIAGVTAIGAIPTLGADIPEGAGAIVGLTGAMATKAWNTFKNINIISNVASSPALLGEFKASLAMGKTVGEALQSRAIINSVINTAGFKAKTALVSSAEAASEAQNVMQELRKKLNDDQSNATPDEIEKTVKAAGTSTYFLNQALLNYTMPIEFKNLFGATLTSKISKGIPVAIKADLATSSVKTITGFAEKNGENFFGKAIRFIENPSTWASHSVMGILENAGVEGGQESTQFLIQNSVEDYYKTKFNNKDKNSFVDVLKSTYRGLPSLLSDEGLANFTGGAVMGMQGIVAGGIGSEINHKFLNGKIPFLNSDYSKTVYNRNIASNDSQNLTENLLNYATTLYADNIKKYEDAAPDDKKKAYDDSIYAVRNQVDKDVFTVAMHGINQGNLDSRLDGWRDLITNNPVNNSTESLNQFEKMYGAPLVDPSKSYESDFDQQRVVARNEVVNSIVSKLQSAKDAYNVINNAYSVNPFDTDRGFTGIFNKIKNPDVKKQASQVWSAVKQQASELLYLQNVKSDRLDKVLDTIKSNPLFITEREDILHSFVTSPIVGLNEHLKGKINDEKHQGAFHSFLNFLKDKSDLTTQFGVDKESADFVVQNDPELQQLQELHSNLSKNLEDGNMNAFYRELYSHLHDDYTINEDTYNKFVIDTTDALRLNLGHQFLVDQNNKLQSVKGQKDLVLRNLNTLQFYDFMHDVKVEHGNGTVNNISVQTPQAQQAAEQLEIPTVEPIEKKKPFSERVQNEVNKVKNVLDKYKGFHGEIQDIAKDKSDKIRDIAKEIDESSDDLETKKIAKELADASSEMKHGFLAPLSEKVENNKEWTRELVEENVAKINDLVKQLQEIENIANKNGIDNKLNNLQEFTLNTVKPNTLPDGLSEEYKNIALKNQYYFVPEKVNDELKLASKLRVSSLYLKDSKVSENDNRIQGTKKGVTISDLTKQLLPLIIKGDTSVLDNQYKQGISNNILSSAYDKLKETLNKAIPLMIKKIDPNFNGDFKEYIKNNDIKIFTDQVVSMDGSDYAGEVPIILIKGDKSYLFSIDSTYVLKNGKIASREYYYGNGNINDSNFYRNIKKMSAYSYMLEQKFGIHSESSHVITIATEDKFNRFTEDFEFVTQIKDFHISDDIFDDKKNDVEDIFFKTIDELHQNKISANEKLTANFDLKTIIKDRNVSQYGVSLENNGAKAENIPSPEINQQNVLKSQLKDVNLELNNEVEIDLC